MLPDKYLTIIELSLKNLSEKMIVEKYSFVSFLPDTLSAFSGK
jgi:hypothetical protein